MKEMFKGALKLFGKALITNFFCFFIVISITSLMVTAFSEVTGYYVTATKGKDIINYTHYIKDGEDTRVKQYEAQGYTVNQQKLRETSVGGDIAAGIIIQIFNIGILSCMVYPYLWERGYKERNLVLTGNSKPNPLKGLKLGLLAIIPAFLFLIFAAATDFPIVIFKMLNSVQYPVIELIAGSTMSFSALHIWQIVLIAISLLLLPFMAFLGYYLGYKDFSIWERIIYRKGK
ncbi:MAG: hypothetical protein IJO62_04460 [Clostridia bacterium]|nr:hypothetical protein [Clostridia bacterium]